MIMIMSMSMSMSISMSMSTSTAEVSICRISPWGLLHRKSWGIDLGLDNNHVDVTTQNHVFEDSGSEEEEFQGVIGTTNNFLDDFGQVFW